MIKEWQLPSQCLIDLYVAWCAWNPLITAQNVSNVHQMIINYIPQVVSRQAIGLEQNGIVNVSISIIKETAIVLMAGMFDFLGVLQGALIDPEWNIGDQIRQTGYFFAGVASKSRLILTLSPIPASVGPPVDTL